MNMDVENNRTSNNLLVHREEFETVYGIITTHTNRVMSAMHNESLNMLWEVGAYVSNRINHASWGDGVVRMLAEYIHTRNPKAKGWSYPRYTKWFNSMKPIPLMALGNWSIITVCSTICRMSNQKKDLQVRVQLCQSDWHKFLQCFSQQAGATIS